MKKSIVIAAAASSALMAVAFAGQARAGFTQGSFQADGWNITYPADMSLSLAPGSTPTTLELISTMAFTLNKGALIAFTQADPAAVSKIVFQNDTVQNQTGGSWDGFSFLTESPLGVDAGGQFDSPGGVFTVTSPFTSTSFTAQLVQLSGGVIPNNSGADFSAGKTGGGLVIDASPAPSGIPASFVFKEFPVTPGGVATVPLPPASWTSLSTLAGLALIPIARRARKIKPG